MVPNKKLPALNTGPSQKAQRDVIYFLFPVKEWKPTVNCPKIEAHTTKIVKFLVRIISEHP